MNNLVGSYYPVASPVHSLNCVSKLLCTLLLIAAVICTQSLAGYALLAALSVLLTLTAALPFGRVFGGVAHLWLFLTLIFCMNAFFYESEAAIWRWWIFTLSPTGLMQGANVVLRTALAVIFAALLMCTATPTEITAALEKLMTPLKYVKIPTAQIAMIISVAMQFIPTLFDETQQIRKAQTARGAPLESKSLIKRTAGVFSLAIPVFLAAFRRADELAQAMEARGYRAGKSCARKKKLVWQKGDIISVITALLILAAAVLYL